MSRRHRRLTRRERRFLGIAAVVVAVAGLVSGAHGASSSPTGAGAPSGAAAQAIAYAEQQEGCPYVYGGTGPCSAGFDCSGLVMEAYASAGVTIARTSEEQWATGEQISASQLQPGDLVFFTGDPIDPPPGHVGIYVGPNQIIDAYATGFNVLQQSFGLPSSWEGLQTVYGYTDPLGS